MQITALQTALKYAAKGWSVFPIAPRTKVPYKNTHWKQDSTNDSDKIQTLAELYPDSNWALDCGKSNVFVLDIDTAKGAAPPDDQNPDHSTFAVRTPSGGYHLYYQGTGPTSTGTKSGAGLGQGLDTRGVGGYVLIPGSINGEGKTYQVIRSAPLLPIPSALLSKLANTTAIKSPERDIPLIDVDLPHNVKRAETYLTTDAPEAIEGDSGDKTTYTVICRLRDFGLSQDKSIELLTADNGWNDTKAHPPWAYHDLERKVQSVYKYAKDRLGNASIDMLFPPSRSTGAIRCVADIKPGEIKPRNWLLGYRYLPGYVTLTIAPGGVGKSLFTILEAASIVSGRMLTGDTVWNGGGAVWLYNTEDPFDELERRFLAVMKYYKIKPSELENLFYSSAYKTPMVLATYDNNKKIVVNETLVAAIIREITKRNIKLFVVDPFVECHELTENDNPGMNKVMQIFRRIAFETNCAVSLVHHSSKVAGRGADGGRGNMDTSRGASAITSAARIAHTLYPMSPKEAKSYGLGGMDATWYIRLDDAKSNLGPPIGSRGQRWFKKVGVKVVDTVDTGVEKVNGAKTDNATGANGANSVEAAGGVETTGVLVLMEDMVEVVGENEHDILIIDSVTELIGLNENKSVYTVAKEILDVGLIQLKAKTLQNKIENLFSIPVVKAGCVWRLGQTEARNGQFAVSVVCHIDE